MATKKPLVKAYIELGLKEKLKQICDEEKRSESNMIEYLIDRYVKEYEAKTAKEQERAEVKSKLSDSKIG